jgi:hypothetical protein
MNRSNTPSARRRRKQNGATLLIAMIFLVLLTLIVISAIKATNVNTRVVGNMQMLKETEAAAQVAIETVISTNFTTAPAAQTVTVDINDSGKASSTYTVNVPAPTCVSVKPISVAQLDVGNPSDIPCFVSGASQNTGIIGGASTSGNSLCASTVWDVSATATAPSVSTTSSTTHQGVAVRVPVGTAC